MKEGGREGERDKQRKNKGGCENNRSLPIRYLEIKKVANSLNIVELLVHA